MHPKNSTTLITKQAPLLTRASEFHLADNEGKHFFAVTAGLLVSDVLNEASTILGAVESVASKLQDCDLDANDIYLIRLMVGAAQSLINASTFPVEFGNREGGAK